MWYVLNYYFLSEEVRAQFGKGYEKGWHSTKLEQRPGQQKPTVWQHEVDMYNKLSKP